MTAPHCDRCVTHHDRHVAARCIAAIGVGRCETCQADAPLVCFDVGDYARVCAKCLAYAQGLVGGVAPPPASALVVAVQALRTQRDAVAKQFDATRDAINAELDAVGGFATTSPEWTNGKGYCRDFTRRDDSFGGGVLVVGEDGPFGKVAPYQAEVGDRCFALEQAWQQEAQKLTAASQAVAALVRPFLPHGGMVDDALVAAAEAVVDMEETR